MASVRRVGSSPLSVAGAIGILALASGVTIAVLQLVDRALVRPPAGVTAPDTLVSLAFARAGSTPTASPMATTTWVTYRELAAHVSSFTGAAAWQRTETALFVGDEQVPVTLLQVSGNYFDVLGSRARIGRALQPQDDRSAAPVVVLGDALWKRRFASDPGAVGRTIVVNGQELTVVGIMGPGFTGHSTANVDLWIPYSTARRNEPGWSVDPYRRVASVVARLAPGRTIAAAEADASAAADLHVSLSRITGADTTATEARITWWLTGIAALLLALGAANATTLLVVRAVRRTREFAIRAALGASQARLIGEASLEAGAIAAVTGATALLFAGWIEESIRRVLLPQLSAEPVLSSRLIVGALAAGALAFGVAFAASWTRIRQTVRTPDLSVAIRISRSQRVAQQALLIVQASLCVVLLAGTGMFGRSLYNLLSQDFGMRMDNVLLVEFDDPSAFVPDQAAVFRAGLERVRALPSVVKATVIGMVPFTGFQVPPISVPGRPTPAVDEQLPFLHPATPEFLDILGVRIVDGRGFTDRDESGPPVVIVNETMARGVWPGDRAVGKCIRIGFDPGFDPATADGPPTPSAAVPCRTVIGVAHDIRQRSVLPTGSEAHLMQYFVPFTQVPPPPGGVPAGPGVHGLLVRVAHADAATIAAVGRAVVNGRGDLPYLRVRPYEDLVADQLKPLHTATALLILFAALGTLVAGCGLYAVFAQAVALRKRELAIRAAVGATPAAVVGIVLREALLLVGAGLGVGWLVASWSVQSVRALLYGSSPMDPVIGAALTLLMIVLTVVATWAPARAAARANPAALLRAE